MSFQYKTLIPLVALVLVGACGRADSADQTWPDDEYDQVSRSQKAALESADVPIDQAMRDLAQMDRAQLALIAPEPSEDLSAMNGWSFAGAGPAAAGDVTMPPECAGAPNPEACWGQTLYAAKGCIACHAIEGDRQQPCPNWSGLYGKERRLTSGETVIADDAYIANSITNSWDQIVEGYGKTMPPYDLPDQEVQALVAYVKSVGGGS